MLKIKLRILQILMI